MLTLAPVAGLALDAPAPVTIIAASSSPIELSQAQVLTDNSNTRLWIVYRNVSSSTVDRFAITISWRTANGRLVGSTFRMVNVAIGAGETTTAELSGIALHPNAQVYVGVTRARFHDLALWVAPPPPPPPVAMANASQDIAGRRPVTTQLEPPVTSVAQVASPNPVASSVQSVAATPSSAPIAQVVSSRPVLAQGTPVVLRVTDDLSSATASDGDRVSFTVVSDLAAAGKVLIPSGARGLGHVESVRRAGRFGRSGSFTIIPDIVVATDGSIIPLQGSTVVRPPTTAFAVIADLTIIGGLFARGREASLQAGSVVTAATAVVVASVPSRP